MQYMYRLKDFHEVLQHDSISSNKLSLKIEFYMKKKALNLISQV